MTTVADAWGAGSWTAARWGRHGQRESVRVVHSASTPTHLKRKFKPQMHRRGREANVIWVWVGTLGHHFCSRQHKRTRADKTGRRIKIALTSGQPRSGAVHVD